MKTLFPIDYVTKEATSEIARITKLVELRGAVLKALERFDGKKVTKAFSTALVLALPEASVYYNPDCGVDRRINVWGVQIGIDYDHRVSFLFPANDLFDYAKFRAEQTEWIESSTRRAIELHNRLGQFWNLETRFRKASDEYEAAVEAFGPLGPIALKGY